MGSGSSFLTARMPHPDLAPDRRSVPRCTSCGLARRADWDWWQRHRFDISADLLKAFLEPPGSFLDVIELAALWTVLPDLHARVKTAIAIGPIALCHFSHAYEQGCCAYFTFGGSGADEQDA